MTAGDIRPAGMQDISAIQKIIDSVWPNSGTSGDRIVNVLNDSTHATLVYENVDEIAGFVDGFLTTTANGIKRWELDLLAVQPAFQRQGIASKLIAADTSLGQLRGAKIARGLVAFDNLGSQGAFARCGYETDGEICELLVANSGHKLGEDFESGLAADYVRVKTINYSGIWIEGQRTKTRLEVALNHLMNSQDDLAGTVVPEHETEVIKVAKSLGFESLGRYQWWQRSLVEP